jgi:hypothetical protein
MKNYILSFSIFLFSISLIGQSFSSQDPDYIDNVKAGESKLNEAEYDSCVIYYQSAFEIKQTSFLSLMRGAACAFSNGDEVLRDKWMSKAFDNSWGGAKNVFDTHPEFDYLRGGDFEKMVTKRFEAAAEDAGVDLELMSEFDTIAVYDQKWRRLMRDTSDTYGWDSPQMAALWDKQNHWDSLNTLRIEEVIAEQGGYPGRSLVGDRHASTAFLVIQHAPLETQVKYIDMMKEAADADEVRWSSIALLIDRVNLGLGKKQIYGSQLARNKETGNYYFSPMVNPYKIDSIRSTVGLGPLQAYADNWDFTFDIEEHLEIWAEMGEEGEKD